MHLITCTKDMILIAYTGLNLVVGFSSKFKNPSTLQMGPEFVENVPVITFHYIILYVTFT